MKVGYSVDGYQNRRTIINKVEQYNYIKVLDIYKILFKFALINQNVLKQSTPDLVDFIYRFNDLNLNKVDLLHFWNTISYGKTPWITTFETIVPRFKSTINCHHGKNCGYSSVKEDRKILNALETLSGKSCKKLIALSECNLKMQKDFLSNFPEFKSEIEAKLIYMHPPQKANVENYESKKLDLNEYIHFMLVGNDFFRKGGSEILEAFMELRKSNNYNIKLTIVSSLIADNYAAMTTNEEVEKAKEIISKNRNWIDFYPKLSYPQMYEIMKSAHIGLLPTYADTYGLSALDFQATGCPIISTNVRALPEVNNNEIGWVIKIPINRLGEAIYTNFEDRMEIKQAIKKGLLEITSEIMENRDLIPIKADKALNQIRDQHSPEEYSRKIGEIYSHALE